MRIAHDITQLIGHTPLVQLNRIPTAEECLGRIVLKLEGMNPSRSLKARIGISMIQAAKETGPFTLTRRYWWSQLQATRVLHCDGGGS